MALASVAASGVGNGVPVRQSEYSAYSTTHCRDFHAKCFRGGSAATADGAPGPVPPRGLLARLPGGAAAGEGCRGTEAWESSRVGIGGPVVQRALTAREVNKMTLLAMGRKRVRPSGGDVCTGGVHGGSGGAGGAEGRRGKAPAAAAAASLTQMLAADPSGVRFVRGAPSNGAMMNKATGHILQPDDSAAAATKWVTEAQEAFQRRSRSGGGGSGAGAAAAAAAPAAAAGKGYQQSLARRRHDGAEASESGHWDTVYALGYRPATRWAPGDCARSVVPADQRGGGGGRGSARNSAYSQSVSRLFNPADTEPCLNPQILKGRGGGSGNSLLNEGQQQCSIAHSHYVEQKLRAIGQPTVPLHKAPPFCRDSLHVQEADCEPGGMRENTFVMRMRRQMKLAKPLAVAAGD